MSLVEPKVHYSYVIGVDEVGLGAWAGPLVVAGVVVPKDWSHPKVKDSKAYHGTKKVSAHDHRTSVLLRHIRPAAKYYHVESIPAEEIDKLGVQPALSRAVQSIAVRSYALYPDSVVVLDGNRGVRMDFLPKNRLLVLPKADVLVPAVSAASVLAKVTRDEMMKKLHEEYPQYHFNKNVGYGTDEHKAAMKKDGLCPQHRKSYKPVRSLLT
jgi:ribonuclease HII